MTSTFLRSRAAVLAATGVVLIAAPFLLGGRVPRDPVEPQKITIGAAAILGVLLLVGLAASAGSVLTGIVAVWRRDWMATVLSVPAPAVAAARLFYFWATGGM